MQGALGKQIEAVANVRITATRPFISLLFGGLLRKEFPQGSPRWAILFPLHRGAGNVRDGHLLQRKWPRRGVAVVQVNPMIEVTVKRRDPGQAMTCKTLVYDRDPAPF